MPFATVRETLARWALMAAVSALAMTSAAVAARSGQTAPKMVADV
jgi:hypothetical protein